MELFSPGLVFSSWSRNAEKSDPDLESFRIHNTDTHPHLKYILIC